MSRRSFLKKLGAGGSLGLLAPPPAGERSSHVAAFLSQFPNVYADVSFYSNFPGTLEEILRTFLGLAPSEKVMHGSDSGSVPETIGYCADNVRRTLSKVLSDYRAHYGWTDGDCERMARNVLSENARRVYRIDL